MSGEASLNFTRDHRARRGAKNNVAIWVGRRVKLQCGHKTTALPVVTTTVGEPDRYRCPEGCGIQPGRLARKAA